MEIAVGYVCAYLVRKARRAGQQADTEVDRVVDAGMERVHDLVSGAIGEDRALQLAEEQAQTGDVSERTRRRLTDAVDEAAEQDTAFADALRKAVEQVQEAAKASGAMVASGDGIAIGGSTTITAEGGSAAAVRMGDVTLGNPPVPGPPQT
ncbi:hypothetical protein SAMN05216251_1362 [Actinacidiphila alni]|uniref:Chromosome partitioning protein n=1 Tax=Actinacidiphila alni TaxID=380248 RepID=A0A1I2MNH1_9ACTN|nr:chromosome partitioning protein [Actinacidiphila alni]SFF90671.1 hypothetical protein SAMN05216251_1362 [Actinacidiphila alni]